MSMNDQSDRRKREESNVEKVRLELYAQGLPRGCSPFAIITLLANDPSEQPNILGKTEVLANSQNPRWTTYTDLEYDFAKNVRINVGIYDKAKNQVESIIGSAMFEVGEVLGSKANMKAKRLRKGGSVFARITPAPKGQDGKVEFRFRGIDLKNVDGFFSKTDAFFDLSTQVMTPTGRSWQVLYRSKPVENDLNPVWDSGTIGLNRLCDGDIDRPIQFNLWHHNNNGKHLYMGNFETSVRALVRASLGDNGGTNSASMSTRNIDIMKVFVVQKAGKEFGKIAVITAKINMDDGSCFAPGSTYHTPSLTTATVNLVPAFTGTLSNGQNRPTTQSVLPLTENNNLVMKEQVPTLDVPQDVQQSVKQDNHLNDSPFSQALTQTQQLTEAAASPEVIDYPIAHLTPMMPPTTQTTSLPSTSPVNQPKNTVPIETDTSSTPSPNLYPQSFSALNLSPVKNIPTTRPTFTQYLAGGCEIELSIAIDFTGSNGDPRLPGTLHYRNPDNKLNDYEKAITAIGGVIGRYDMDQNFPVLGFGAKYNGVIQHCFQVGNSSELHGISSVLRAYRKVFETGLTMSGPTVFSEVIDYSAAAARSKQEAMKSKGQQAYRVLLILTDGAVTDIEQTKQSLISASDAPLSIVIVGIGSADFSAMHFLDNFAESINGGRDICQFVEFSKYCDDKAGLTKATLEEIPDQLVDYFYRDGIMPMPPISGSAFSLSGDVSEAGVYDVDLQINLDPDGTPSLINNNGAIYDDTKYDTYSAYALSQSQQSLLSQSSTSVANTSPTSYTSQSHLNGFGSQSANSFYKPHSEQQHIATSTQSTAERIFYVKTPANCRPGMQITVTNPVTNQMMLVTIPNIPPGGTFGVRY